MYMIFISICKGNRTLIGIIQVKSAMGLPETGPSYRRQIDIL